MDVGCILLVVEFSSSYSSTAAAGILTETAFICSFNPFTGNNHSGCAAFIHPTRSYPRFSARSNSLSQLIQHSNTHMPDGGGAYEATGEGVTESVIVLSHGSSVTVQFNPYLLIEHPITHCIVF